MKRKVICVLLALILCAAWVSSAAAALKPIDFVVDECDYLAYWERVELNELAQLGIFVNQLNEYPAPTQAAEIAFAFHHEMTLLGGNHILPPDLHFFQGTLHGSLGPVLQEVRCCGPLQQCGRTVPPPAEPG